MKYLVAERFRSIQGEGVFAGTPMAFLRFCGCSVGKKICHGCDTDFDKPSPWLGGGEFSVDELVGWAGDHVHVCLTGGEPFDQDLNPLLMGLATAYVHIETSGTKPFPESTIIRLVSDVWLSVSPKPGWREDIISPANEIKVIVPGLGSGDGWPILEDALRWARNGKTVFLQPRNDRYTVNPTNLRLCEALVRENPELRLSVQLHKYLGVW